MVEITFWIKKINLQRIDSYEPHAQSMIENGTWNKKGLAARILTFFEGSLAKKADFLIATTERFKYEMSNKLNLDVNKIFVKPACVDLDLFSYKNVKNEYLLKELNLEGKIICVYAGKFGGIYLGNEVFDLILEAEKFWGDRFRFLLLTSHPKEEIELFRQNSGIGLHTIIRKFVKHSEVPNYMGLGDFALTPVKSVPSKRFCTPIKDGEYWALGLPIVITKEISDDSEIIERNAIGYVLKELTNQEYFNAVQKIDTFLKGKSRMEIYNKIRPFAEKYRNLQIADGVYQEIYGN
ncbi:MAG: hypothetical protein HYU67_08130 [Flavobacteriia bacterium]|nr:hypothetical protein [Flavobacteriia bacterium]